MVKRLDKRFLLSIPQAILSQVQVSSSLSLPGQLQLANASGGIITIPSEGEREGGREGGREREGGLGYGVYIREAKGREAGMVREKKRFCNGGRVR